MQKVDRRKKKIFIGLSLLIILLGVSILVYLFLNDDSAREMTAKDRIPVSLKRLYVGETPIGEYCIVSKRGTKSAAKRMQGLIEGVSGEVLSIVSQADENVPTILLEGDQNSEQPEAGISIQDGMIIISGYDSEECLNNVNLFANTFLGWDFAGEEREHISAVQQEIHITENYVSETGFAWMEEREPIICLWDTDTARGSYYTADTSLKSELMSYSDDQLYAYVRMMKYCGFTGIQVTDMCSTWAAYGGYEFVQERIRFMADVAHSLGMKFTLWVWGAEFNGYNWVDDSVAYYDYEKSMYAYDNPAAVATFEKYYSIYAQLADCTDRVIMHFNDPGKLTTSEDVGYFSKMLRDKFYAVNPQVDFGVSFYTNFFSAETVSDYLSGDFTLYVGTAPTDAINWTGLRLLTMQRQLGLGVWSWNLVEMEIDQIAEMNVNPKLIQEVYQKTAEYDQLAKPTYWSEMDSYHVVNIFSLYCAAKLLEDPNQDPQRLLGQIANEVAGDKYGKALFELLNIVQDARTGDSWQSFRWGNEEYLLTSDQYDAQDILERCNEYLPVLDEMIAANLESCRVPMPVSVTELLQLIRPHLEQIRLFAQFRKDFAELEEQYVKGADIDTLSGRLDEIYQPIPEFNCIIGMWGQPEQRAQYTLVAEFCNNAQIPIPKRPLFDYRRKERIYHEFCTLQKISKERVTFDKETGFQTGGAFGVEASVRIIDELVEQGLLSETEEGKVYVTDWEQYRYNFS